MPSWKFSSNNKAYRDTSATKRKARSLWNKLNLRWAIRRQADNVIGMHVWCVGAA